MKLTEDETSEYLRQYLTENNWQIESYASGHTKGIDIICSKVDEIMYVEVKGARANDNSPSKKRSHFSSGQIKTHFGVAIVKMLQEKAKNPNIKLAIAHPNDKEIRKVIDKLIPFLKNLKITHFWVSKDNIEII